MSDTDIDKSLNAITVIGETITVTIDAFEDKKVNFMEAFAILRKAVGFIGVIKNGKEIVAEFKDYNEDEREQIKEAFAQHFNLPNNQTIEILIEKIFAWLIIGSEMIELFKIALKKEE